MRILLSMFAPLLMSVSLIAAEAEATAPKSIAEVLQPFVERGALAGAVTVVVSKDKVLSFDTVGYANVEKREPMREDSLFWIASMSKPITGVGLMILIDEGKVSLDDPVEKHLPEFKGQTLVEADKDKNILLKKPSRPITVREVMAHTSGLPFLSRIEKKIDGFSLKESVISYALTPLNTEPGTKYAYSNAGINIGGRIIEVVSGMPYEEFMEKRIFKPLGMKDTTFWPSESKLKHLAQAYKPTKEKTGLEPIEISQFTYPLTDRKRGPCPAGGYFSTAKDVATFCRILLNGGELNGKRILSEAAIKQMTTKQTAEGLSSYGVGFSVENKPGGGFGHGGAYSTDMWIDPARGIATVYMVAHAGFPHDGGKALPAFKKAAFELFGK